MTASLEKQKEKQTKTKCPPTFQTQFLALSFSFVISFNLLEETTPGQAILIAGIINLTEANGKKGICISVTKWIKGNFPRARCCCQDCPEERKIITEDYL